MGKSHEECGDALTNLFLKRVCKLCGICEAPDNPEFCTLFCHADCMKFFKDIVVTAAMLKRSDPEKFERIRSFEGFCALHCKICPFRGPDCSGLRQRVECYQHFLEQSSTVDVGEEIDKARLYEKWSGIDLDTIPKLEKDANAVSKNARKRITKKAKNAKKDATTIIEGIRKGKNKKHKPKVKNRGKKKDISTTFFYNEEDEGWKELINKYLEITTPNEDNNRQSDKTAGSTT